MIRVSFTDKPIDRTEKLILGSYYIVHYFNCWNILSKVCGMKKLVPQGLF